MLSYDGEETRSVAAKVGEVKKNVKSMYDMINKLKEAELEEAKKKAALEEAERIKEMKMYDFHDHLFLSFIHRHH